MSLPFSKLPANSWRNMGFNAGVLLTDYDPGAGRPDPGAIIGATTGAVRFSARPVLMDFGRGLTNCPPNARELMAVAGWDVRLSGAFISADTPATRRIIALADMDGGRVTPRCAASEADFGDLWYVVDYGGVHSGDDPGRYAIRMKNALSTGGFRLVAEGGKRARWPFEFTAFCSVSGDDAPFEVYVIGGGAA